MRSHRSLRLFPVSLICLAIFSIRVLLIAKSEPPISKNQSNAISEAQNLRAAELALVATVPPPVSFAPTVTYPAGGAQTESVAIGDVNGDGYPDLVAVSLCQNSDCGGGPASLVSVLLGNGDGTLGAPVNYNSGGYRSTFIAIADVSGDGRPDLVVGNVCLSTDCLITSSAGDVERGGSVSVLLGNGDGTFQSPISCSFGANSSGSVSVAAGDLNGDGHLDLVVASGSQPSSRSAAAVSVLLGNGDGTFQAPVLYSSGGQFSISVTAGDVNGDGHLDLVVANKYECYSCLNGEVSVLLGNGDGTFKAPVSYSSGGSQPESVAISDLNSDGHPDLIVANNCMVDDSDYPRCAGVVSVLLGKGDGTFQSPVGYSSGGYSNWSFPTSVAVGDLNGDGRPDLVVTNFCRTRACSDGAVGVLRGNGDGTFQPTVTYGTGDGTSTSPVRAKSGAIADLNGDGRPDLFVANSNYYFSSVAVRLNRTRYLSTTKLTTSGNPTLVHQAITFTAAITPRPFPDGQIVTFYDGATAIGTSSIASGIAALTTSSLSNRTHIIKATYPGGAFESASSGTVTQVVNGFPTTTTLTSSLNPSTYGQKISWIAKVNTSGTILPTGTVAFTWSDGFRTYTIGSAILSANGIAILTKSNLNAADQFPLIALYKGDSNNAPSSSPLLSQTVLQTTSTAAITSSTNPSTVGQAVTFTAKFTSPTVIPSGPVTFKTGTMVLGTAQLSSGKAIFTTSTLQAGSTIVKVIYNGNSNIRGSSASITQTVQP